MSLDNIYMTDDELNKLTDMVLDKLIQKAQSPHWHQYNTPMTIGELIKGQLPFKETEEEFLIGELARLTTLMHMYETQEEYMKAAIIKRKLDIIQNKLDNDD
tara:strand:- start:448 stop:753 length:306 start_codon:yes stop_codon:yes gene_type:complete